MFNFLLCRELVVTVNCIPVQERSATCRIVVSTEVDALAHNAPISYMPKIGLWWGRVGG